MARFDRYMLSQLMVLFGFFSLVLVMVYWINRAVVLFDQLIADGQSAMVFLEFTALTLPNVVRVVLPISAFVATVYVTNRLSSESELVVMQSTGYSSYRLARPVLYFGLIVALLMSVLTHLLVPASKRALAERQAEISQSVTARFLSEGSFLHPAAGITFYIREISPFGELRDIFLSDGRDDAVTTYTAKRALLARDGGQPKLLMFDGMAQSLGPDGRLFVTSFDDFAYDIGGLISDTTRTARTTDELMTPDLFARNPALLAEVGATPSAFLYEATERIVQPLLAVVTSLVGFSCLLLGGFSRFGIWRQIIMAIVLLVALKALDNKMTDIARTEETLWMMQYVTIIVGLLVSWVLLFVSVRPTLFRRRARVTA